MAKGTKGESQIEDAEIVSETQTPAEVAAENEAAPAAESAAAEAPTGESPLIDENAFKNFLGTNKQNFGAGEPKKEDAPGDGGEPGTEDAQSAGGESAPAGEAKKMTKGATDYSAAAVVGMIDFIAVLAVTLTLKHAQESEVKATDSEREKMEKAWALAMEESGMYVSPWYQVMLLTGAIYGPKVYSAYKANQQTEEVIARMVADEIARQKAGIGVPPPAAKNTAPFVQAAANAIPLVVKEQVITACPTCGNTVRPGYKFCDGDCRSRYMADKARIDKNQPPMYIGKSKEEADKIAKQQAKK